MGLFTDLIRKVHKGAERVGCALGVVDKIDNGKPLGTFRGSASFEGKSRGKVLAEMYTEFDETTRSKEELVSTPPDNMDHCEANYSKIMYQPAILAFEGAKKVIDDRRLRNFRRNLDLTIQEYNSGSWRNAHYYKLNIDARGFVPSSVNEDSVRETVNYYAMKITSMGATERDLKLLTLASRITGRDYSSRAIKSK